jgi:hypothetical protein
MATEHERMSRIRMALAAAALVCGATLAHAQTVQDGRGSSAPGLELSGAQRQTIYQSISQTQKNNAAPIGFRPAVGEHVPEGIPMEPLPGTLATLIPQAKGLEVAMVEKQVMLVDPKAKVVVALVTAE